jgi:type III secretion system FlhB-like substrate exporter
MWIIQKNAVSNEQQDKVQELQISFRSGEKTYSVLINKSMEFSQSLLRVSIGADTIPKTKYQPIADILRIPQE